MNRQILKSYRHLTAEPAPKEVAARAVKGRLLQGLAAIGGLAIATIASPALAEALANWNFNPATNHLEVTVKAGTKPRYFLMAQPARIVLDLPDTSIGDVKTQAAYSGAIRQIRVSQFQPGITRIVMELSPEVRLAPGQVKLESAEAAAGNTRWVLRPLIARASAPSSASQPAAQEPTPPASAPVTPRSSPTPAAVPAQKPAPATPAITSPGNSEAIAPSTPLVANQKPALPPQTPATDSPPSRPADEPALPAAEDIKPAKPAEVKVSVPPPASVSNLPTAAPAAPITPVGNSEATAPPAPEASPPAGKARDLLAPGASSASVSVAPSRRSPAAANARTTLDIPPPLNQTPAKTNAPSVSVPPLGRSEAPQPDRSPTASAPLVQSSPSDAEVSNALPTVSVPNSTSAASSTVSVPPLKASPTPAPVGPVEAATPLPPAASSAQPPAVTVPPTQSQPDLNSAPVIEFGQPLPQVAAIRRVDQGRLPAGTPLSLRYPGTASLSLKADNPQQEVLLLQTDVRDESGKVLLPEGSQVIGRFETTSAGSRFIAQAISLRGRNLPLEAESNSLTGGRNVSDRQLIQNSGIGALAGGILGSFSGLGILGGAATGAAITVVTSPKPATIEPGQIFQVRLRQDLLIQSGG